MFKTKIEIKTFGDTVLFEHKAGDNTLKKTLEKAVEEGADLRGADLGGAYLRGAYLGDVDLRDAYLRGAYLRGADLGGAYLRGAYLRGAHLGDVDLRDVDLRGAYLRGADLRGAKNIPQSYINQCSRDMLFIFSYLKKELPFLREKLVEGKVDGTQYEGECCCLIGTLANEDGGVDKVCSNIPYYEKGLHNYGEQWFFNIRPGDTPENNEFASHAVKLIDEIIKKEEVGYRAESLDQKPDTTVKTTSKRQRLLHRQIGGENGNILWAMAFYVRRTNIGT